MFENCYTQDEARAEYHRLAKMLHPDIGGNNAEMAGINVAYSQFKPRDSRQQSETLERNHEEYSTHVNQAEQPKRRPSARKEKNVINFITSNLPWNMTTFEAQNWRDGQGQVGG